jgi:hypothetical protein
MMEDFKGLLQDITIYHKIQNSWVRYNLIASLRNTSYLNRNNTGTSISDNAVIRIFDVEGYNNTWNIEKGDVVLDIKSEYDIIKAPLTELREKYGKSSVYEVSSVEKFIFEDDDIKELNHIKIGGR